jgi:mannose-6-phosphate isomerase-like protein (cupin superfamily)
MSNRNAYTKYSFVGRSGYVTPRISTQKLVTLGHTAGVMPWQDSGIHKHDQSEEYYLLLHGNLILLVGKEVVTLQPREILMIRPQTPHAIVGGEGLIEHLGIRTPALDDKRITGEIPAVLPTAAQEHERELQGDWGCRIPLEAARNRNCWLFGTGSARVLSSYMTFAYLNFPTIEEANAGLGTRHRLHLHERSWEYYVALQGTKTLQVGDELVEVGAGEVLEVPPQVKHTLYSRQAPYEGFTFRAPAGFGDKVEY